MRRYAERTLWRLASARTHRPVFAAMLWVWWWTTLT